MKEDFLHYLWDSSKIPPGALCTSKGCPVVIKDPGVYNANAGPDFLNAAIYIGDTLWAGHVEMHLRSSMWYDHRHHYNELYDNVILHVVWEHDREVFYPDGSAIPVISLQAIIPDSLLENYLSLSEVSPRFINCSGRVADFGTDTWKSWLSELYRRRLQNRASRLNNVTPLYAGHWEELLLRGVFRAMGAKVNAEAFYSIAVALGVERIRKMASAGEDLEVVFHGMAGFFRETKGDNFYRSRRSEFRFLSRKYDLDPRSVERPVFFRLRPSGFPTIRLSQLAQMYGSGASLFSRLLECGTLQEFRNIFTVDAHSYWDTRHTYASGNSTLVVKRVTQTRADLVLLNAVFPLLFAYHLNRGRDFSTDIMALVSRMSPENNRVTEAFIREGVQPANALESQGLLELHANLCTHNKCLECRVGQFIIGG